MFRPTISVAVYPYRRSAPRFQLVMVPSRSLPMMASSEESMIAAKEAAKACQADRGSFLGSGSTVIDPFRRR